MSGPNSSNPGAGAPAEALGLAAPGLAGARAPAAAQVRRARLTLLALLLACAVPVVASYFTYYVVRPHGGGAAYAQLIQPGVPIPELDARALDGRTIHLPALRGQWLLVVIGDAACPPACERRLFLQRQLREMTGRERDRIDKVWLVTDDAPLAPALREALVATPAMHVLRVPRAQVVRWLAPEPGHALDEHLYVVDPMGLWMMRAPSDPDPARLKRDIERLLRAAAGWDQPGRP